jgi:hypothetical protein
MRRLIALTALILAPVMVAGCGADGGVEPGRSVVGTYVLTSFDGGPPPITLAEEGELKLELIGDQLELAPGGTFTQRTTFRFTDAGVPSMEGHVEIGTYTVSGSTLTFRFASDGSTVSAGVSGDTLTITSEGHTVVYVRP